ncbi:MAG: glucosyltransferase domain-containing protein [Peptococcaceae bacterium]|jgi:hypothetical protein|nr:glucosyltransferase domain-containing protein [Peptococcaceae bacterium]
MEPYNGASVWTKGKWLDPEEAFRNIWKRIPSHCRMAMIAIFVAGLVTHMFFIVNKLPNGDDLSELYHFNSMISSGRWLDIVSKGLTMYYSLPWATGLVCLMLLAVSGALICDVMGLRRRSCIIAAASILVAFPIMASYFSYLYYMDLYMLTLLFNVWAVWLAQRRKWGFVLGAALIAFGLGNYQAYLGVTAVLCLLVLIRSCLNGEGNTSRVLMLALRFVIMGVMGLALYFLILRGFLMFFAASLSGYQGVAGMGASAADPASLFGIVKSAYKGFLDYFYQDRFFASPLAVKCLYSLLLALSLAWLFVASYRRFHEKRSQDSIGRLVLLPIFLVALPIGYNLIYFMAPDAYLHSLMQPQYSLFWLMPIMFFELAYPAPSRGKQTIDGEDGEEEVKTAVVKTVGERRRTAIFQCMTHWLLLLAVAGMVYYYFLIVNISYLHLHLKYEITYATELRILDRVEALPDYHTDTVVCVVGAFPNGNMSLYPYHTQDIVKGLVGINGNLVHHYYNYNGFYKNYLGRQLNLLMDDDEWKMSILAWPEVLEMPLWPKEGSVAMVRGVAVIKINEP